MSPKNFWRLPLALLLLSFCQFTSAQSSASKSAAELRGSVTPERAWWDVLHYDLTLEVFPNSRSLKGKTKIAFRVLSPGSVLQLDLQKPLQVTEVLMGSTKLPLRRKGHVHWITFPKKFETGTNAEITVAFEGTPTPSRNPPWSGGLSWKKDKQGAHFIATTCQGIGASIWWPNKDHGYDEPDKGMDIHVTVPQDLVAVSNGRLVKTEMDKDGKTKTFHWQVKNPINNYGVNLNIGNYVHFSEKYRGEFGTLDMDYWVLKQDEAKARKHFVEAPRVIEAFEYWFGKYPFYEDSYKLVQVPYLGMEHQSSVTYGNGFRNGYRGRDLSRTGVGLKFDFIIVHESAHEWFGNNISMRDAADMWIHEAFACYAESLFVEYFFTGKEAQDYVIGIRGNIMNDRPIIGTYGRNESGSGDMYYKGANMLHTLRQIIDNDILWRRIMIGVNKEFWHKTVTTQEFESYMGKMAGLDLSRFFDQYLRTKNVPRLIYKIEGSTVTFRFEDVVKGFTMPVKVKVNDELILLKISDQVQKYRADSPIKKFDIDRNLYILSQEE